MKNRIIASLLCCCILFCLVVPSFAKTLKNKKLSIDSSNIELATVEASVLNSAANLRYRLEVTHNTERYYYDLYPDQTTAIPLQMGEGAYKFQLYEQAHDTFYNTAGEIKLNLASDDVEKVWLQPNVKVNYVPYENRLLAILDKWISPNDSKEEKIEKITFISRNCFAYDYVGLYTREKPAYVNFDFILSTGLGMCEELAALSVSLFRLESIPAKLVIGKSNGITHAWVEIINDNENILLDPSTSELVQLRTEYHPERYY